MSAVLSLDPFTVDPDEKGRVGLFFPAKAEALGVLMKRDGQAVPIGVVKHRLSENHEWRLVYGLHRLRGALAAGIDIKAIEIEGDNERLAQAQAAENAHRRELEPLERAMFVHAVASAARARVLAEHGVDNDKALAAKAKSRLGKVQYHDFQKADQHAEAAGVNLTRAYGWREETAEALGFDLNSVKRSMRIHHCIIEPFRELILAFQDHPVAKVQANLIEIAKIADASKRRYVIEALIAGTATLGEAMLSAGLRPPKSEQSTFEKFSTQILGGWDRLGTADKRRMIPEFARRVPPGMRVLLREELDRLEAGE